MLGCNGILSEVGGGMGMRQCMYEWMVCRVGLERNEGKDICVIPVKGSFTSLSGTDERDRAACREGH